MKSIKRFSGFFTFGLVLAWSFAGAFLVGCNKPGPNQVQSTQTTAIPDTNKADAETPAPPSNEVIHPTHDEKICFACNGKGTVPCPAHGCKNGQVDCPGPCMKLDSGRWVHMDVPGHDPSELWMKFQETGGSWQAWSQHHVGEVVVMQNGKAVNIGRCKICGGTTKVNCPLCKGSGTQVCNVCEGKKYIPETWTPSDNPWINRQPDLIRLRDGTALLGKIALSNSSYMTVQGRDGKITHIKDSDILPASEFKSSLQPAK
jgi:hypothetical protein